MKRTRIALVLFTALVSCTTSTDVEKTEDKTQKEIIYTENRKDNEALFSNFTAALKAEKFVIEESKGGGAYSWYDGNQYLDLVVEGEGIRWYYVKRSEDEPEGYYPDFVLNVFEFKDEKEAKLYFNKINAAIHSNADYANGKGPQALARNKNEVFYFSSRAEMFRRYIEGFAQKIEAYS